MNMRRRTWFIFGTFQHRLSCLSDESLVLQDNTEK